MIEAERPATALMLTVLPVLPPDLRPLVVHGAGFATSDLNDLYRRVINRNDRLARLLELQAPKIIIDDEQAKLQGAIDELMVEGHRGNHTDGGRRSSSFEIVDQIFGQRIFEKAVDYSGVAHLVVDPTLAPDECRVPRSMLIELFKPHAFGILEEHGYVTTIKSAKRMITERRPEGLAAIEEASEGYPVLLMAERAVVTRRVRSWDQPAIAVDESTARRLASTVVTLHVPLMHEAALQATRSLVEADALGSPEAATGQGWLCRARTHGTLVMEVAQAALRGTRDELSDPVVALSLGRPPAAIDVWELEGWAEQERARRAAIWERLRPEPEQGGASARNPALDRGVDELELSVRTSNGLANAGIATIGQLCQRTEVDLLETKHFGRRSLLEIKEILADLGLSLGMRDA